MAKKTNCDRRCATKKCKALRTCDCMCEGSFTDEHLIDSCKAACRSNRVPSTKSDFLCKQYGAMKYFQETGVSLPCLDLPDPTTTGYTSTPPPTMPPPTGVTNPIGKGEPITERRINQALLDSEITTVYAESSMPNARTSPTKAKNNNKFIGISALIVLIAVGLIVYFKTRK